MYVEVRITGGRCLMSIEGETVNFSSVQSLSLYSIGGWDTVVTFDYFSFTGEYTAHSGSHRKV